MAITSLSAQYISASFQNLVQVSSSGQLFDGVGNQITNLTASFAVTASYALNAGTGTSIDTGSFATTGSNVFNGAQTINGDLIVTGSITAYQYVISSSVINETIVFSSGSTIFGDDITDTHTFTGSLYMSGSIYTPESIYFYTTASALTQIGQLAWDDGAGTLDLLLKGGNVDVELGQENVVLVYNGNGTSFNKGEVVFVSGSQGNRPSVNRAIANSDAYSVTTLGFTAEPIAPGSEGYVTTFGFIDNINTNGTIAGSPVWLSPTISGSWSTTQPVAPDHTVLLGYIVRVHPSVGSIFVNISNGWEIGELHDVRDTTTTSSFGDLIVKSGSIWVTNKQLTGSYSVTGNWNVTGSLTVTGSSTFKVIGPSEFTGSVAINGTLSAPAASITAQSVSSDTVIATNYVSGSQLIVPGFAISSSIGDALDPNGTMPFTTTITPEDPGSSQALVFSELIEPVFQGLNLYVNSGDNSGASNGIYSGIFLNTAHIGIPTHFKTSFTNQTVSRQNGLYIGAMQAHPSDKQSYPADGLYGPLPALTILPWSGSYSGGWITQRPNQIGINKYDSAYSTNTGLSSPQQMGSLNATLDVNGSVMVSGSLTVTASINAQSVTASLFGTASYAVNSLTASYALSGGSGGTSATVATAQTGSVTGTTSETLIQTLTIPANTLTTNDFARFSTKIFATNSNNYTVALYINSANTLNGSEKNITTLPVNSSIKFVVPTRTIAVNNVTTDTNWISENTQVQEPFQGTSATAHASSSIDWTTTQYALVSVTPQNAGDSFICRGTYFEKI